jgi:hypothetical protein
VAEIRGLSVNQVLGLTSEPEVASETLSAAAPSSNGDGASEAAEESEESEA